MEDASRAYAISVGRGRLSEIASSVAPSRGAVNRIVWKRKFFGEEFFVLRHFCGDFSMVMVKSRVSTRVPRQNGCFDRSSRASTDRRIVAADANFFREKLGLFSLFPKYLPDAREDDATGAQRGGLVRTLLRTFDRIQVFFPDKLRVKDKKGTKMLVFSNFPR